MVFPKIEGKVVRAEKRNRKKNCGIERKSRIVDDSELGNVFFRKNEGWKLNSMHSNPSYSIFRMERFVSANGFSVYRCMLFG